MLIDVKVPNCPNPSPRERWTRFWHKKAGEAVCPRRNLIDIETDKVVLDCRHLMVVSW